MAPLPDIPLQGDERTLLEAFLEYHRAALLDRADGLTDDEMHIALAPSTLTMARLIGHMCMVERTWFTVRFGGEDMTEPWASLDFTDDFDAEMTYSQSLSRQALMAEFSRITDDSRRRARDAELDAISANGYADGEHWNMRWILIHLIEEYARHCGHADLIRESIDGSSASNP